MNQTILASALAAVSLSLAAPAFAGPVLDKVKANDVVVCGVNTAAPGFSNADSKGTVSYTHLTLPTNSRV